MTDTLLCCRRARTLPDQIKELKAELPPKDKEGNRPSSPQLEQEIADLEKVTLPHAFQETKCPDWTFYIDFLYNALLYVS